MEGTMVLRIGNVLYTVRVKSAENAKDTFENKLKKIIEKAAIDELNDEERNAQNSISKD